MLKPLKRWWQLRTGQVDTPIDNDAPWWFLSLACHVLLLVVLTKILMPDPSQRELRLTANPTEVVDLLPAQTQVTFEPIVPQNIGADSFDATELAPDQTPLLEVVAENPVEITPPPVELGSIMASLEFDQASSDRLSSVPSKGSVGQAVAGASGAIDRITQEILLSLEERKTTVVWLFDQSASLMRQRAEISARFERVYRELDTIASQGSSAFTKHGEKPLLTQVYAFGQSFHRMLPEPSHDGALLREAVDRIERDDSGLEYVFSAVIQTATDFQKLRRVNRLTGQRERNVMIIVVSDEAGDDLPRLDEAVSTVTNLEIPVYVVGIPAPFGREVTQVKWVDPDPQYDQSPQWAPVSQGPESLMVERLQLDYVGGNFEDLEMIDSGFGPFGLTRLCYESGGIYFAVHPNRQLGRRLRESETAEFSAHLQYFFDQDQMRKYKPDYVSIATYQQRLTSNRARQTLVQAAQLSRVGALQSPVLVFPKLNEAAFVNQVNLAQRSAALLEPKMQQLYEVLKQGEAARETELVPRWQAGYDLAYGRVLAGKVRVEAYNAMLALIKTKLKFEDDRNNTWVLRAADSIDIGSQATTMAEKAKYYLQRVIQEHPGTPWAMLAERELATPIGWKWGETFTPPPPEMVAANNNNNNVPRPPQPQPTQPPRQLRPPPKL